MILFPPIRPRIADKVYGRWQSLEEWFTGTDGKDSEAAKVFDTTNEIIRKITRNSVVFIISSAFTLFNSRI